ncbi:MAG: ribosome assembly RNA-binding protein YhbY [Lachnospiraceae bacterium]|nr:ribosome assembly RNA-binding protein YhbY [Lachnospiraceae bacterium]
MTSKQRSYLMKLAATQTPLFQIGKSGLTPELVTAVGEALEARELVKINVLKNCFDDLRNVADALAGRSRSQVVTVIGRKIVLYRPSKTKKVIELP